MARKYKCPFCNKTYERQKLSTHISNVHEDMIDDEHEYTADRIVFDICNNKEPVGNGHSNCRICKKPTKWNPKLNRYDAYCSNECKQKAREMYKENMLRVRGAYNLLSDPEWQENKMLANRKISDKYRWSDGTYKTYVGSYERKFLEFCDNVLDIDSSDLITPGPKIEYEYEGEKHVWITDAIYLPYKLVFDIKDGGDNKNNREMKSYREKQIMKEKFITDQGQYNYIRLTNNEFDQLLQIFAELKMMYLEMDGDSIKTISRIHETPGSAAIMGALPRQGATDFVMPPGECQRNIFVTSFEKDDNSNIEFDSILDSVEKKKEKRHRGYVVSNDIVSEYVLYVEDNYIHKIRSNTILDDDTNVSIYKYTGDDYSDKLMEIYTAYKENKEVDDDYFILLLTEFSDILSQDQLRYSKYLSEVNLGIVDEMVNTIKESAEYYKEMYLNHNMIDTTRFPILDPIKNQYCKGLLEDYTDKGVNIFEDIKGRYFVYNESKVKHSKFVDNIENITRDMINSVL